MIRFPFNVFRFFFEMHELENYYVCHASGIYINEYVLNAIQCERSEHESGSFSFLLFNKSADVAFYQLMDKKKLWNVVENVWKVVTSPVWHLLFRRQYPRWPWSRTSFEYYMVVKPARNIYFIRLSSSDRCQRPYFS